MAEKKNSIMREREAARRARVELKTENMSDTALPAQEAEKKVPHTFKKKLANFWYHNKFVVLGTAFALLVAGVCIGQWLSRPVYDCNVVVYLSSFMDKPCEDALQAELSKHCPDVNGDGEVNVLIINCSVYEEQTVTQQTDNTARLQAQLLEGKNVLFVIDEKTVIQLDAYAPALLAENGLPDLDGRAIKLNGTEIDKAVQAADIYDILQNDYYIAARSFGDNSAVTADTKANETARTVIKNILTDIIGEE